MASATVRGAQSTDYEESKGLGLVIFAAIMLMVVGIFNLIDGIAAVANSHIFVANAHYVVGDLRAWGWLVLFLGVLLLLAGVGVLAGNQLARWFGVAMIGLNLIAQLFFIPAYPFWALTIIALDALALWGLCAYGSRSNVAGD
ncbi:MAG TPA: hypothetical protein VF070_16395 [Streptosporangiaceae bacterium]